MCSWSRLSPLSRPVAGLVVGAVVSQAAVARSVAAQPVARAVAGEVVEAETGASLADATVALLPATPGVLAAEAGGGSAFLAGARRTVTGTDGRYRFADVAAGHYVLRVYRLGFRPATVEVELRGEGAGGVTGGASDPARVSVGLTVVPIRLRPVAVDGAATEPYARRARTARGVADARAAAFRVRQARFLSTDVREVTHADVEDAVTLGETDLFRALQRLPGVATQGDASAQLWTRGARWDQTRVTWDGLPLFNPLHAGGVLSAVNGDAVGAAFLLPGVRPASIGDGSAAVVDLRSRAGGGTGALRGDGELSLLSGRAALDQTVAGGRGSWMVAARRSYLDLIANRINYDSAGPNPFPYHIGEVAARADWHFGGGRTLEVSALRSRDQIDDDSAKTALQGEARVWGRTEGQGWGNTVARATLAGPARLGALGAVALRTTLGASTYAGDLTWTVAGYAGAPLTFDDPDRFTPVPIRPTRQPVHERLAYVALTGEVSPAEDGSAGGAARWTGGYALSAQRAVAEGALGTVYTPDALDSTETRRGVTLPMLALWGERRLTPAAGLVVAAGLRVEAGTPTRGDGPVRPAPRVTARYRPGDGNTTYSAAVGRHYQYVQGLAESSLNTDPSLAVLRPIPLWLAADRTTPALRTDVATVGVERWTGAGWDWTANAYLRRSAGLLLADEGPGLALGRPLYAVGAEAGRGVELGVRRVVGRVTGSASYALASATTDAYGLRFPSAQDRRHVFNATAGVRLGRGGRLGASYTATSGAPVTPAYRGSVRFDSAVAGAARYPVWVQVPEFGAPGSARLPAFARLDLVAEWMWAIRRARVGGYLQFINATGRRNPLGVATWDQGATSPYPLPAGAGHASDGFITLPLVGLRASF